MLCGCPGPVVNPPANKCEGVRCTGTQLCNPVTGQCEASPVDAGRDAGTQDAGQPDAGSDAGVVDAGFDAGFDAGVDAGFDAGVIDAGLDAGEVDAGCGSDLECFGVQHCDPSTRNCVECFLDSQCLSSVLPTCDLRTNTCVGCVSTANCTNPLPICDAQQCLPCNTSAECGQGRECNFGSGECNPLNDTCATARTLLPAGTGTSSISAEPGQGIDDTAGTCNTAGPELVYTFTTTTLQALTVTVAPVAGSLARPVAFLRSGCTGTQLACDAPVSGSAGLSIASLPIGTYFLFVESANGAPGRVSLTVSLLPPATSSSNDSCAGATMLSVNGGSVTRSVVVGNTLIATNDNTVEPSCSATARSAGPDLVYGYTLTARSNVSVVARPISGSALHPVVSIRAPCLAPNTESACQAASAAVAVQANVAGQQPGTYFVMVDSADGTTGAFQLELDANPTVDNDACSAPAALTFSGNTATALGDTTWATNGNVLGDLTPSCSDSARGTGRDVVFSYTLAAAQDVTVSVTPTGASPTFNPVVSVRATTCADATRPGERGCVSPLAPSVGRLSLINQPAGTYFVWVDSAADTSGPFQLEVVTAPPTPPPANDSCAAPEVLTFTNDVATVNGSTLQAANDNYAGDVSPTCSPSAKQSGRDVVYQFTLAQPKDVTLSLTPAVGSTLIPALYVRRGTCGSQLLSDEVVCLNQVGGVSTQQTNLAAGTYYVFVDSSGGTSGAFTLTVTQSAPTSAPANDTCAGAQALVFSGNLATATGTTFGASNSNSPTDNAPACGTDFIPRRFGRDLVYSYTLTGAQDVDVTVTPSAGSGLVPTLYVRAPTMCSSFSAGYELACVAESTVKPLRIYLPNQVAGTYFLFVDSNSYTTGGYTLTVTKRPATLPPSNDTCTAPTPVLAGTAGVTGDTSGATDNYSALTYPAACRGRGFFDARDLVYQYTATATGTMTATVSPEATFDAALLLLQPACGAAQCVRFADGAGAGVPEAFSFAVTAGQTYFLVVDSWNREMPNTFGRFTLTVQ
ncbi:MAG: hypothetical protein Q8L48_40950 [Archangium sp.]|nr:hypothetical protein [Archangium sp.]